MQSFDRRTFLATLAVAPMPTLQNSRPRILESPKGKEARTSLRKVQASTAPSILPTTLPRQNSPPSGLSISGIEVLGNNVHLSWNGGVAPYQVESSNNLGSWSELDYPSTLATQQTVHANGPSAQFRIHSNVILSAIDTFDNKPRYRWRAPLID